MITVCTVRRVSRVQFFDILLCKSAIRRLFFPSCIIVALSADYLFRLGWIRAFVRIWCSGGDACLLSGNPKMRNPELEKTDENQNPESTDQRKQFLQIRENLLCRAFALKKNKRTSKFKKSSNKNSLSVEICAAVISSEGYDYENRNKVRY